MALDEFTVLAYYYVQWEVMLLRKVSCGTVTVQKLIPDEVVLFFILFGFFFKLNTEMQNWS